MLISTPEELRLYLPSHVMQNLDGMLGYLDNSEHDFLADRIGEPLLTAVNEHYAQLSSPSESVVNASRTTDSYLTTAPVSAASLADPTSPVSAASPADPTTPVSDASPSDSTPTPIVCSTDPWLLLIILCQRCIVYDAFARAADIQLVSVNNGSINLPSSDNYDTATTDSIKNYKAQLVKESHAAANRLLVQLERWQQSIPVSSTTDVVLSSSAAQSQSTDPATAATAAISTIVNLWHHSQYYYYADGLLLPTATEFQKFVNIYDSREKFIQLLPDIAYCQETHLEFELGPDLLEDLIEKNRHSALNKYEAKAYRLLQRTLSLMVESRSKLLSRQSAKDECPGQLNLALDYIKSHSTHFDQHSYKLSPLYDPSATVTESSPSGNTSTCPCCTSSSSTSPSSDSGFSMLVSSII